MKNSILEKFFPIWKNAQYDLHSISRWSDYLNDGIGKNMIRQSTLQHTLSVSLFGDKCTLLLSPYVKKFSGKELDESLMQRALKIHDLAEGLTEKGDIVAPKKTDKDDLAEYLAFKEHFSGMRKDIYEKYEYAFLLQFASKNPGCFPWEARELMEKISTFHYFETLAFQAIEKFEYLFYPIWMEKRHPYLLAWVMRNHLPTYQKLAPMLPGFREEIFTHSLEKWMNNYLEEHKHIPEQFPFKKKVV